MEHGSFHLYPDKFILRVRGHICTSGEELLASEPFLAFFDQFLDGLKRQNSQISGRLPWKTG